MSDIDDQRVARRGAAAGEPAGASPQGVAPGKRVATRRLAPARESRPVEHTTTHDTHGGIAPSDPTAAAATDDPFGMHLLAESSPAASGPGGDGLALDEGAAPAALPIVTPGSSSSGRRLAFEPSRLQMPATRIGQTSPTRAATLTNHSRKPVEIVDLIPMGRTPTVTSGGDIPSRLAV